MTDTLIAINEGMILNQRKTQTSNLQQKPRVQIDASKGLQRLSEGSFQQA